MFSAQIGFLSQTSYADLQQQDQQRTNSARILINAVQAAIVAHADANSSWWKSNRERIALNHECALRFFAIIACTKYPDANLVLIAGLLQKEICAEADLLSEVGELLRVAFVRFDSSTQDKVTATILALGKESSSNEQWLGRVRAQLSSAIPCCLRSPQAQATVDTYKIIVGPITNQTFLITRGGMVTAPFSVDVFLKASNDDVLKLLHHYLGHDSEHDSLVGGQHQVGQQLTEAASRQPSRFLSFLQAQWNLIPPYFCDCVLNGMAIYLAYRYGNSTPQPNWKPLEDPELSNFVSQVLEELEKHSEIWLQLESVIHALEASVHIVETNPEAQRLTVLANRITDACDESDLPDQSIDLVTQGFRMRRGRVAIALITLATQRLKNAVLLPDILTSAMLRIAADEHPAVRALVLRHLPYVQHQDPELG